MDDQPRPFEQYLSSSSSLEGALGMPSSSWSSPYPSVPFAIPHFLQDMPSVAPGGGAEVIQWGDSSWFAKNGFQQPIQGMHSPTNHYFSSSSALSFNVQQLQNNMLSLDASTSPFPLYSSSGFDLLGVLRHIPAELLHSMGVGAVDMSTAFCVCDARRYDCPMVYVSEGFSQMTGYSTAECRGRNCRFLQAPPAEGEVLRGAQRKWTSDEVVKEIRCLIDDKGKGKSGGFRGSLVNYRKSGEAFMNFVTIIPVDIDEERFFIGLQVDLSVQTRKIETAAIQGDYLLSGGYSASTRSPKDKDKLSIGTIHPELSKLLEASAFLASFPVPAHSDKDSHALSRILLSDNVLSDVIVVLSLKGAFLYAADNMNSVLGYHAQRDCLGHGVEIMCKPEDIVPLERELKEGKRNVDVLFRAHSGDGQWLWIQSRGRLVVEPGKARKAIVMLASRQGSFGLTTLDGILAKRGRIAYGTVYEKAPHYVLSLSMESGLPADESFIGRPVSRLVSAWAGAEAEIHGDMFVLFSKGLDQKSGRETGEDFFAELRPEKKTSWSYEMQDLKFRSAGTKRKRSEEE